MNKSNKIIPIFFSTDNNYVPFLAVSIKSLLDNASKDYFYNIHVLTDGISDENKIKLQEVLTNNSKLIFDDMSQYVSRIKERLNSTLRDYYTTSIFYRLFIAALYPEYDKAIYLDCDITVIGDISKMFKIDLKDNIFGAVPDDVIASREEFKAYAREGVGIDDKKYFNSGVLLMNLVKYREEKIKERFVYLLVKYNFETVCPDQDYLNVLCKDKILYIERGWDRMSTDENYDGPVYIIHYNNFGKPWYYDNIPYQKYFWEYAIKTPYYDKILSIKNGFTQEMAEKHIKGAQGLLEATIKIVNSDKNFKKVLKK
ncbi:MAG: glycosyltransferase family 8 protein [Clostridiales bacterium]|nr:glycosyltransferase family 8 protein [Clostridiales bacterium]